MELNRGRRSLRLSPFDYSFDGVYAVTVCTRKRLCRLGTIADERISLSVDGWVVDEAWRSIPSRFPGVKLDAYVVMPNHLHGILIFEEIPGIIPKPLGEIIGAFKSETARRVRAIRGATFEGLWQRSFYEHVVRDEEDLAHAREYIANNIVNWETDAENPRARK